MPRLKVTPTAKREAEKALRKRRMQVPSRKVGLAPTEARRMGIASGVSRARQLIRSKSISMSDAERVAAFYQRFKNCRTPRCEQAIDLWGGRTFGSKAVRFVRKNR